ncbi:hypothetical protein EV424DRAFT_1389373 [Suillus variegatus]|nr:hypothetical protein EV424DRAFT_1389373 [Suillus variegatus]
MCFCCQMLFVKLYALLIGTVGSGVHCFALVLMPRQTNSINIMSSTRITIVFNGPRPEPLLVPKYVLQDDRKCHKRLTILRQYDCTRST